MLPIRRARGGWGSVNKEKEREKWREVAALRNDYKTNKQILCGWMWGGEEIEREKEGKSFMISPSTSALLFFSFSTDKMALLVFLYVVFFLFFCFVLLKCWNQPKKAER